MNVPNGGYPNLGQGQVLTEDEKKELMKAQHMKLAVQFMGNLLNNLPQVLTEDSYRPMSPKEVFLYAMELEEQVANFMSADEPTIIKQ